MNDERVKILQMVQEGKISVEEAVRLIKAAEDPEPTQQPPVVPAVVDVPIVPASEHKSTIVAPVTAIPVVNTVEPTESVRPVGRLSLRFILGVNLDGARMEGANFENAKILFSNLDGAKLRNADFRDAWVVGANLDGANFEGADLRGAVLAGVNLDNADFRGADLRDAVLMAGNFDSADFRGADLRGRRFIAVNMESHKYRATPVEMISRSEIS